MSDKLNEIIKHHVNQHEYNIDPEDIWAGINKKTKKKRYPFWLLSLFLAFTIAFSYLGYITLDSKQLEPKPTANSSKTLNNKTDNTAEISQISQTRQRSLQTELNPQTTSSSKTNTDNKTAEIIKNSKAKKTESAQLESRTVIKKSHAPIDVKPKQYKSHDTKSAQNGMAIDEKESKQKTIPPTFTHPANIAVDALSEIRLKCPAGNVPELKNTDLYYNESLLIQDFSKLRLYVKSGINFTSQVIEAADEETRRMLSATEMALPTIEGELLLQYAFTPRLNLSTGLSYQKVESLFTWSGELLTDASGTVLSLYDKNEGLPSSATGLYYESIDRNIKNYNQTRLIDLPIQIDYLIADWKLRPRVALAAAINLSKNINGYRLDKSGIPFNLSDLQNENKIGIRYRTSLSVEYPLTPFLLLQAQAAVSTRKIEELNLSSRYYWYGCSIGMAYKL